MGKSSWCMFKCCCLSEGVDPNDPAQAVSSPNTGDNNDPDDPVALKTTPANVTNGVKNPDHEHPDHSVVPVASDPHVVITSDASTVDNPADNQPDLPRFPTPEACDELSMDDINEILSFLQRQVSKRSASEAEASTSRVQASISKFFSPYKESIGRFLTSVPVSKFSAGRAGLTLLKEGLDGLGGSHWTLAILCVAGWAIDKCKTNSENKEDLRRLLDDVVKLMNRMIKPLWGAMNEINPTSNEQQMIKILHETAIVALECAIYTLTLMDEHKQISQALLLWIQGGDEKDAIDCIRERLETAKQEVRDALAIITYDNVSCPAHQVQYKPNLEIIVGARTSQLIQSIIKTYYVDESVFVVMLHGMGGMGKSTIATEVFVHFQTNEQQKYIFCRIELTLGGDKLEMCRMQNKMLQNLSGKKRGKLFSLGEGRNMLQTALEEVKRRGKRVFLYVDNLERKYGVENWMPEAKFFPEGSKMLVTSRNVGTCMDLVTQQLKLSNAGVENQGGKLHYKFMGVGKVEVEEAREILRKYVGPRELWEEGWVGAMEDQVLVKCDGLPLALKVVGSHIHAEYEAFIAFSSSPARAGIEEKVRQSREVWNKVLENMEIAVPLDGGREDELYHRLRFSIDTLDPVLKSAFFYLLRITAFSVFITSPSFLVHSVGTDRLKILHDRGLVSWPPAAEYGQMPIVQDVMRDLGTRMMQDDPDEIWINNYERSDWASFDRWDKVVGIGGGYKPPVNNNMPKLRSLLFIKMGGRIRLPSNLVLAWDMMLDYDSTLDFYDCANSLRVLHVNRLEVTEYIAECWRGLKVLHALECKLLCFPVSRLMRHWKSLVELHIEDCPDISSIPDAAAIWRDLKHLTLNKCCNLIYISEEAATAWINLEQLYLTDCENLKIFPKSSGSAWTELRVLEVSNCYHLCGLETSSAMNWHNLKEVHLSDCHELTSIPDGAAGWKALRNLTLLNCSKDNFNISEEAIAAWTNLQHLIISESYANLTKNIPKSVEVQYKSNNIPASSQL